MWDTFSTLVSEGMSSNWGLGASLAFMVVGCGGLAAGLRARWRGDGEDGLAVETRR